MKLERISSLLGCGAVGADRDIDILLTDSRSLSDAADTLFFALRTSSGDGHHYIDELYRRGVRAFVVERHWRPDAATLLPGADFLRVDDTLMALQRVGTAHRDNAASVVAITGSRGKTVLKEWLFQLLSPLKKVARSPRSFNSRIGVPLSLWEIAPSTDFAIIEAGVSKSGEMEILRQMIAPDTVIVTNVGSAHAEGFSSLAEKALEKVSLAAGAGTRRLIYCLDDDAVTEAVRTLSLPGVERVGWSAEVTRCTAEGTEVTYRCNGKEYPLQLPFTTDADIQNAGHLLLFAISEGVDPEWVCQRIPALAPVGTRLNVIEGVNGCSIIYDSYTSDLGSLRPAIDFMLRRATPGQTPVVVMSDLAHEVADDDTACRGIASLLEACGIDRFVGVGPVLSAHKSLFGPSARFYRTTDEMLTTLSTGDFVGEIILLKGAPQYDFGRILERLEARTHETVLEVNLDAVVENYNYFRSKLPHSTGLVAMVKASGYGAGSYEIAKTLQDCGASYLAVAVLDEGVDLRRQGITMPVMVMNPKVVNYGAMFANRLEPEIYSFDMLHEVIAEARRHGVEHYPIHIKLDTGMHRTGFIEDELPALMDIIASQEGVEIRSAFSHLATADCLDMDEYTLAQLERFDRCTNYMLSRSDRPFLRHVLNTAGILRFPQYHYDMARLGIGLYGVETLPPEAEKPLANVSALRTIIVAKRTYAPGEAIGYSRRSVLARQTDVATIPIGYADGMNRHFGVGAVTVRVNGHDAPTIGNICMDACMIDVTGIECKVGDRVEIFGPEAPIHRLSDLLGTIPYEILTSVSPRVKRVYYRE